MGEIDWATVFGTLENATATSNQQPQHPLTGRPEDVPRSEQRGPQLPQRSRQHSYRQDQPNAEAGPSRPLPPSRSYSLPQTGYDDQAFGLFAHDHASRAWFANNAAVHASSGSHGPASTTAGASTLDRSLDGRLGAEQFAVPAVPPPTPFPLTPLDQHQQQSFLSQATHQHGQFSTPWLFDFASQPHSQQASPTPGVPVGGHSSAVPAVTNFDDGTVPLSRPPSTPSSASRPTPGTVLDQEDKRMRNTMASAKFRAKKKQQTQETQRIVNELETQRNDLEKDVASLKQENGLLREIVQLKYGWKVDPGGGAGEGNPINKEGIKTP